MKFLKLATLNKLLTYLPPVLNSIVWKYQCNPIEIKCSGNMAKILVRLLLLLKEESEFSITFTPSLDLDEKNFKMTKCTGANYERANYERAKHTGRDYERAKHTKVNPGMYIECLTFSSTSLAKLYFPSSFFEYYHCSDKLSFGLENNFGGLKIISNLKLKSLFIVLGEKDENAKDAKDKKDKIGNNALYFIADRNRETKKQNINRFNNGNTNDNDNTNDDNTNDNDGNNDEEEYNYFYFQQGICNNNVFDYIPIRINQQFSEPISINFTKGEEIYDGLITNHGDSITSFSFNGNESAICNKLFFEFKRLCNILGVDKVRIDVVNDHPIIFSGEFNLGMELGNGLLEYCIAPVVSS